MLQEPQEHRLCKLNKLRAGVAAMSWHCFAKDRGVASQAAYAPSYVGRGLTCL